MNKNMKEKLKTFVQLPDNLFPKLLINFLAGMMPIAIFFCIVFLIVPIEVTGISNRWMQCFIVVRYTFLSTFGCCVSIWIILMLGNLVLKSLFKIKNYIDSLKM